MMALLMSWVLAVGKPEDAPSWDVPDGLLALLVVSGFVIGAAGHLFKSRAAVATGITMILVATLILPVAAFLGGS